MQHYEEIMNQLSIEDLVRKQASLKKDMQVNMLSLNEEMDKVTRIQSPKD